MYRIMAIYLMIMSGESMNSPIFGNSIVQFAEVMKDFLRN